MSVYTLIDGTSKPTSQYDKHLYQHRPNTAEGYFGLLKIEKRHQWGLSSRQ